MLGLLVTALIARAGVAETAPRVAVLVPEAQTSALEPVSSRLALELHSAGYDVAAPAVVATGADMAWAAALQLASPEAPWAAVGLQATATHTTANVWFMRESAGGLQGWSSSTSSARDAAGALLALRVAEILHALRHGHPVAGRPLEAAAPTPPAPPPPPPPPSKRSSMWLGFGVKHLRFVEGLGGAWLPEVALAVRPRGSGLGGGLRLFGIGSAAQAETAAGVASLQTRGMQVAARWDWPARRRVRAHMAAGPMLLRHAVAGGAGAGFVARSYKVWRPGVGFDLGIALDVAGPLSLELSAGGRWEQSLALRLGSQIAARTGPLALHAALNLQMRLW